MRRFSASDGSSDDSHSWKTVFDKNVPIKEIAVVSNVDNWNNRLYFYAILDQSAAAVTTTEAAATASDTETYLYDQQPTIVYTTEDPKKMISHFADHPKLIFPEKILNDYKAGKTLTRVIVNLRDPGKVQDVIAVRPDFKNPAVRQEVKEQVKVAQDKVINDIIKQVEIQITNRFTYAFGFSAEVTLEGLLSLSNHPDVISIEEDMLLHADLAQGIPLINAAAVRNTYNGSGMAIAILDTGIDYNHPRLGNGGFPNSKVIGGYDTGENKSDPMDRNGHGTAVAGIAAGDLGTVGDYIGGVAYNAKLYALKISNTATGGSAWYSDMVEAVEWCITHQNDDPENPIMIISQSFSGGYFTSVCGSYMPAYTTAAANAKAVGITLFNSTGNDGYCDGVGFPACLSDIIAVGAVYDANVGSKASCISQNSCIGFYHPGCSTNRACQDSSTAADQVTCYSNSASFIDLFAPNNDACTTGLNNGYNTSFGGTSAACPYAAGSAAALQSAAMTKTGSFLSPDQIQALLVNNGDPVTDPKASITKPRGNLGKAIDNVAMDNLVYYWAVDIDTANPVWNEISTGVKNAWRGLDATWNEDYPSGSPFLCCLLYCGR